MNFLRFTTIIFTTKTIMVPVIAYLLYILLAIIIIIILFCFCGQRMFCFCGQRIFRSGNITTESISGNDRFLSPVVLYVNDDSPEVIIAPNNVTWDKSLQNNKDCNNYTSLLDVWRTLYMLVFYLTCSKKVVFDCFIFYFTVYILL